MPSVIQQDIFVTLDDTDFGIIQMLGNPVGTDQSLGVGVFAGAHKEGETTRIRANFNYSIFVSRLSGF
jgi:hypothetical protein